MKEFQIHIVMDAKNKEDFLQALHQITDSELLYHITEVDE